MRLICSAIYAEPRCKPSLIHHIMTPVIEAALISGSTNVFQLVQTVLKQVYNFFDQEDNLIVVSSVLLDSYQKWKSNFLLYRLALVKYQMLKGIVGIDMKENKQNPLSIKESGFCIIG